MLAAAIKTCLTRDIQYYTQFSSQQSLKNNISLVGHF